jgi:hypothetical protein
MYQSTKHKIPMLCKLILNVIKFRRNLDKHMEKTLRFELELTSDNLLNLAVYDQNEPATSLYLTTINKESFELI